MSVDFATIGGLLLCTCVLILAGIINNGDAATVVTPVEALGLLLILHLC